MAAKKKQSNKPATVPVAVIGMGLMGHSIVACFLAAGYEVVGLTRNLAGHRGTPGHVRRLLQRMRREGLLKRDPGRLIQSFRLSSEIADLAPCGLIVESIVEDLPAKMELFEAVEKHVAPTAIIATNTSSIPISLLQNGAAHPERFLGIHWDEPAHITRFMEIVAGEQTSPRYTRRAMKIAAQLGKEPSLLRRDIRGFIVNRVCYAMYREAFNLVESGICTIEDVDRSLRNAPGYWMPFAGPFRYMDLTGVQAYCHVMKDLLPDLSNSPEIPALMQKVVESGGNGISNRKGFYKYTAAEAKQWAKAFEKFNYEIRRLTLKYPGDFKPNRKRTGR
jgi:3-hydroxybutyryl-CoA dehydrogenase